MDPSALADEEGVAAQVASVLWEVGSFLSLLHNELALGVPHVPPTWLPPLPAFCFAALFLSAWWMACPSGLPEALLNEAVFPPLLLLSVSPYHTVL